MPKKLSKLVLKFSGDNLYALVGNAGEFDECSGLCEQLLKFGSINFGEPKIHLTEHGFICMYQGVIRALNGPRYPNKLSQEYQSMLSVKEIMEHEYERQRGKSISL
ncbi:hypothetical protein [Teredinibacter purpureus]|uniref:hypothetical protein n=1 Tax=Teredinibacter purpureus TaxID=2731756 RepID=UPI0005F8464D|nr:hypothetical protein [Teredinibacter purpureus]